MNSPNPELMELYGTDEYYLEKVGFLGSGMLLSGLRAGAGLGSIYAARAQAKHHEQLDLEAAQLNQHFRLLEARKMATVVESFGGPHDPAASLRPLSKTSSLDPRLEKIAMSLGSSLAYQEMDKEALPSIGSMWKGTKALAGKIFGGSKGVAKMQVGTAGPAIRPGFKPPGVNFHPGTPGAAGMTGAPIPGPKPAPLTSTAPATSTAGAPATTPTAPAKAKPWISTGTKIKAGLGLAGAGAIGTAGLVGAKGLQEAGDYMRTPSHTGGTWGGYGPSPMHNVNPYGYV